MRTLQRMLQDISNQQKTVSETQLSPGVILQAALDQVPPEELQVLRLILFCGHRPKEIATSLGYTVEEVEYLHASALRHVQKYLSSCFRGG